MRIGAVGGAGRACRQGRPQLTRDYHGRRVVAGNDAEAVFQRQLQGLRIAGLDDAVHLLLPGRDGDVQHGLQQAAANALGAVAGQNHECELGPAVLSDILAVTQHLAIEADCQHCDAVAPIDGVETAQQCQVRCLPMGKMALVKAGVVHRGEKSRHLLTVARAGGPDLDRQEIGRPGLTGAHRATLPPARSPSEGVTRVRRCAASWIGRSRAMNSAAALITAGSSSRR